MFKITPAMKAIIAESSRVCFNNLPMADMRTGFKFLKKKPLGPMFTNYYLPSASPYMREFDKGYLDALEERQAERLESFRRRGKGPPKKVCYTNTRTNLCSRTLVANRTSIYHRVRERGLKKPRGRSKLIYLYHKRIYTILQQYYSSNNTIHLVLFLSFHKKIAYPFLFQTVSQNFIHIIVAEFFLYVPGEAVECLFVNI